SCGTHVVHAPPPQRSKRWAIFGSPCGTDTTICSLHILAFGIRAGRIEVSIWCKFGENFTANARRLKAAIQQARKRALRLMLFTRSSLCELIAKDKNGRSCVMPPVL